MNSDKIKAKKSLGQHFLFNQDYLERIIKFSITDYDDIDQIHTIFEIGPGLGSLTDKISKAAGNARVICIEKDADLQPQLAHRWQNVTCLLADALHINWQNIRDAHNDGEKRQYNHVQKHAYEKTYPHTTTPSHHHTILIANLPYNISAPLIIDFILQNFAKRYCILVQKEMAQRVCARVGDDHYGRLAVLAQAYCNVRMCFDIHGDVFKPRTKVMSSFLIIEPKSYNIDQLPRDIESQRINIDQLHTEKFDDAHSPQLQQSILSHTADHPVNVHSPQQSILSHTADHPVNVHSPQLQPFSSDYAGSIDHPLQYFHQLDKLVKVCFSQRRKMLSNIIPAEWIHIFAKHDIDLKQRAEHISVDTYVKLAQEIYHHAIHKD